VRVGCTDDTRPNGAAGYSITGSRVVEHWDELNTLDIFSQVGAVPPLGQPS
jgi:hypothetical protein